MNKRVITLALIYSVLVIIYKLIILLGGYQLTRFGFYYSHVISVFFIFPFIFLAIKQIRDNENGGVIGGREAIKVGLSVSALSLVVISLYSYIEFEWKLRDLSVQYYNSNMYLEFLKGIPNVKPEDYPKIISDNILGLSAFRAVTAKLFSFLLITASFSFIIAVFMKKK